MLNGCLESAKQNRMIAYNPMCDVRIKRTKPQKEKAIFETVELQNDFLTFIENHGIYGTYMPLFATMALTGARVGEILGLTWNDLDFANGTISITKTLQYKNLHDGKGTHFFITEPKTEASSADIPMMKELKKYLLRQKSYKFENALINQCEIDGITGFIFTTKSGKPFTNANVNRVILLVIDAYNEYETNRAGKEKRDAVTVPRMSAHSFRHNMATRLCESCDDIKAIQGILRHANADITLNTYAKVTKAGKNKAIDQLEKAIEFSV
jgi:integrase